ncbi:14286_t:CDS:2, partial [Acaulospora morrowiae]
DSDPDDEVQSEEPGPAAYLAQIDEPAVIIRKARETMEELPAEEGDDAMVREELPTKSREEMVIEEEVSTMTMNEELTEDQVQQGKDVLMKERDAFAQSVQELGRTDI